MPLDRALTFLAALVALPPIAIAADCGCQTLADASVQARTGWRTEWTVQLPFDASRFTVTHVVVADDLVVAQTSDGGVHAIDAGTGPARGTVRWSRRVGVPHGSMLPATVGPSLVMVAGDMGIHGLGKADGLTVFSERTPGVAEASPIEAGSSVYVPAAGGTIEQIQTDRFTDPSARRRLSSQGSLLTAPIDFGKDAIGWITTDGALVVLQLFGESWKRNAVQLPSPAAGRPVVNGDDVYVATTVGDVVRLRLRRTQPLGLEPVWRMPVPGRPEGGMILDGDKLFVSLGIDGVVALDARGGDVAWRAQGGALRFRDGMGVVAAGAGRVWCIDAVGRLSLLDAATGNRIGCVPLDGFTLPVVAPSADRLLLARPDGRLTSLSPQK